MLKNATFLALGLTVCGMMIGCGSGTTAEDIAESYGILNRCNLQPGIADIIQSGQADEMIRNNQAAIRNRVAGCGNNRILVTEYLIHGEVYRIEVRRAIDPTKNIDAARLSYAHATKGDDKKTLQYCKLQSVWNTLKNNSFDAQAEVAYRAWQGSKDGKTRPIRVKKGATPEWAVTEDCLNIAIRTRNWPINTMWFRGLTSDGRHAPQGAMSPTADWMSNDIYAHDGRWIMESPSSSGVQCPNFVNLKLYNAIMGG